MDSVIFLRKPRTGVAKLRSKVSLVFLGKLPERTEMAQQTRSMVTPDSANRILVQRVLPRKDAVQSAD